MIFSKRVVESGLQTKEPHIVLRGIVSEYILNDINGAFQETRDSQDLSKVFFVNYSEIEIKKGTVFRKVFNPVTGEVESLNCELFEITQQFAKSFECIPAGWKTICKIKFMSAIPDLICSLPVINDWFSEKASYIILSNEEFWIQFKKLMP